MREALRTHLAARHLLDAVVAHGRRGAEALFAVAGFADAIEAQSAGGGLDGSYGAFDEFGMWSSGLGQPEYVPIYTTIVWLVLLAPSIALASRRMHDLGYSGWAAAILAIPGLGQVVSILMGLPRGVSGANGYADLQQLSQMQCVSYSIRGGTREILRGMIARGLGLR